MSEQNDALDTAMAEYLAGYEFRADEACHTPTRVERALLDDFVHGLLAELEERGLVSMARSDDHAR